MAKEYEILKIDELTRIGEMGGLDKYYRHSIRTKGGTRLSVDISEKDFTPEKAAPILLERAKNADSILKL